MEFHINTAMYNMAIGYDSFSEPRDELDMTSCEECKVQP